MFYIEQTQKNDCKLRSQRAIFYLPRWFNKDTLDFIFDCNVGTCTKIEFDHAIKLKTHVKNLNFDFCNFDYILWKESKLTDQSKLKEE